MDALEATLASVLSQTTCPDEVIVADDGSNQETEHAIDNFRERVSFPVIHVWQDDKGFRAARIRNKAIARSSGDYIVFIDGDILLDKRFVEDHCRNAESGLFIQGGRVLLSPEKTRKVLESGAGVADVSIFSSGVSGRYKIIHSRLLSKFCSSLDTKSSGSRTCNFSLWYSDIVRVNGFDERFQGWGREDSDLVERLFLIGLKRKKLVFSAIGFHLHHPQQSRGALETNDKILRETIALGEFRCKEGLELHFLSKT
ncbi:MAG: glycosyltransferase family 2 protein [Magnetococcales bacterium]|nr:glycosyltransferase family 2 protein [Magnetococcales bacterium]